MNSAPLSESIPRIGKGKHRASAVDGLGDPDRRLVGDRAVHRPARGDVGHRQGEAELPERVPALVPDEVDLDEAGSSLVPLRPGPDRYLRLEQAPGLGVGAPADLGEELGTLEPAVDRRRAHLAQQRRLVVGELELAVSSQGRDEDSEHRRQALAGWQACDPPAQLEAGDHPGRVHRPASCPDAKDADLARHAQPRPRVIPVPPGQLAELVEDRGLLAPRPASIGRGHLVRHCLAHAHRKLHGSGVVAGAAKRRFLREATTAATRRFLMSQRAQARPGGTRV